MKTKHDSRILNSIFSVLQYFCIIFLHSMFLQYFIIFSDTQYFYTQYFYKRYPSSSSPGPSFPSFLCILRHLPHHLPQHLDKSCLTPKHYLSSSCPHTRSPAYRNSNFAIRKVTEFEWRFRFSLGNLKSRIWFLQGSPFYSGMRGVWLTPPPAQNMLAHIPGSTVFESAGSLNRDLHFLGSTLLKSVEPRMCSHTFRDEGGVAHPPQPRICSHTFRDPTKSSLGHIPALPAQFPGFYKKFAHP